jgi:hypothetical protein
VKRALSIGMLATASVAFAQQPGRVGGGLSLVRPPAFPGIGVPRVHGAAPGFGRSLPVQGLPIFLGGFDYGYPAFAPAPNIVIIQQPPAYVAAPAPPENATPVAEIHEYNATVADRPAAEAEPAAFALALKDGSIYEAVAVTVQDDVVHYVEPEGRHMRVAVNAVDRDRTKRLNRERKLLLQLP